uniref:Uncharacterized protein n=1 Tax=Tanacetum cinerariifolium TaxID=118510 RepID=A0A6L2PCX4_TANCI|nr:hypothetical protein [Tanacetum cinerariifolium]
MRTGFKVVERSQKMDDPNITMVEYIQLEEEKACRRGQAFNWKTATYAIAYNDALTSKLKVSSDYDNEFPAIVYNDALTSDAEVSSEPTKGLEDPYPISLFVLTLGFTQVRELNAIMYVYYIVMDMYMWFVALAGLQLLNIGIDRDWKE